MILVPRAVRVYFATQPTNLRKSFDGLVNEIRHTLGYDPLGGAAVVALAPLGTEAPLAVVVDRAVSRCSGCSAAAVALVPPIAAAPLAGAAPLVAAPLTRAAAVATPSRVGPRYARRGLHERRSDSHRQPRPRSGS